MRQARAGGDALVVLARQNARLQGREYRQPHARRLEAARIVGLNARPRKHVVLWLFHQRADHAQPVGDAPGLGELVGVPCGGALVEGFARVDGVVDGADGLLNWRLAVRAVGIDEVYVAEAEALER